MKWDDSRRDAETQRSTLNNISAEVVNCCVKIHSDLGPGLFESVYEALLYKMLTQKGYHVERQVPVPVRYGGIVLDEGFKADLIVNQTLILELKAVETLAKVHHRQLHTYLKLTGIPLGLLLNFGSSLMKNGIIRIVNHL
jgi:iron complex transport system substrate-binding protein